MALSQPSRILLGIALKNKLLGQEIAALLNAAEPGVHSVTLDTAQTITGAKQFTVPVVADILGTVLNGVYTIGNQTIGGTKTFSSPIVATISGGATATGLTSVNVVGGVVTGGSTGGGSSLGAGQLAQAMALNSLGR